MPSKWFLCPDQEKIEIEACLKNGGCRKGQRCATRPFLRLVAYDRAFRGVSPSSAGNGARLIYLKAVTDYVVDPYQRVWASFGTAVHGKLSIHKYTDNVLAEEPLSDDEMAGIPDVLEEDEEIPGCFCLFDYKSGGSYKVSKQLGLEIIKNDVPILDEQGNPVLLKSGENKGKVKTKAERRIEIHPEKADLFNESLQLNRYRIMYESYGYKISKMIIQAIPRDGGTFVAEGRGIDKNLYLIPIPRLPDIEVLAYYDNLKKEVQAAFDTGYAKKCNSYESWEGRRCEKYCEVSEACSLMGD